MWGKKTKKSMWCGESYSTFPTPFRVLVNDDLHQIFYLYNTLFFFIWLTLLRTSLNFNHQCYGWKVEEIGFSG